jgi:uncharacterized membrane protein YhhN
MPRLTARAGVLAGLYAALGIATSASAAKRIRAGERATKPLLMPVLAAFALVAAGDRKEDMRLPAAYSLLLVSMAVLASGRNRAAAAGGVLFVVSDALIACGLAGINAVPRQESAVMPTYVAAQFLLAAGFLRPQATGTGSRQAGSG